jgi:hypothetical protein
MNLNVVTIRIDKLDANSFRDLATYPPIPAKVEALKHSMKDVGVWPSIIARPTKGGRYEQAFGHQRVFAAKELGIKEIPIIVAALSDEDMVKYMGRENGEDYSTDVLVMLNTWEAGLKYSQSVAKSPKALDVARLLGWTRVTKNGEELDSTASACFGAHALITAGHMSRDDIAGIPLTSAMQIVQRVNANVERLEKMGKQTGRPAAETEAAKKHVYRGGRETAQKVREGTVAPAKIREQVDTDSYTGAKGTKAQMPLFSMFGKTLTDTIDRMLRVDAASEKLAVVVEALPQITLEEDFAIVRQLKFDLGEVATRAKNWEKRLIADKVVNLTRIEK